MATAKKYSGEIMVTDLTGDMSVKWVYREQTKKNVLDFAKAAYEYMMVYSPNSAYIWLNGERIGKITEVGKCLVSV